MDARTLFLTAVAVGALVGCGSSGTGDQQLSNAAARVQRCTERLLERAEVDKLSKAERAGARRYVEITYCARFEKRGWVYDDGALSIDAYVIGMAGVCSRSDAGGETRTIPCDEVDRGNPHLLDCALLHHVRRTEVRRYVTLLERRKKREVACDDGTPVDELGST